MTIFRRLVYAALCAGLLSGIFAAGAHQIGTVPLILEAETYEAAAQHASALTHAHGATAVHEDSTPGWEPETRTERAVYTLAADVLAAIGFALLLAAGFTLRGGAVTWREGLLWGLAGFVIFTVAPGLGLPPELPGSEAAPLAGRQLWWLATIVATGGGIALIAFTRRPGYAILAAVLIALPHLYGAPLPAEPAVAAAPEALAQRFVVAAMLVSFLFWLALGASTAYFYRRFESRAGCSTARP
jgi:cobalt transporter subunit CbtA